MRVVPLVCVLALAVPAAAGDSSANVEFFEKKVRPVLAEHCYSCHGPKKQQAGLRLDTAEGLKKGTDEGPVIAAGDPAKSKLLASIKRVGDYPMPPNKPLPPEAMAALTEWVSLGAPFPAGGEQKANPALTGRDHWAYKPVVDRQPPATKANVENPIDRFLLAKLEPKGLTLSPRADKRTLIRRAYFDLIGLPPTAEEVEAFERDASPDAFAKLVEKLLASPHYGERWGRHWLDVARYADSKGYVFTEDRNYPYAYTYRDYVIRAFNDDKPYNQFVIEQLAADKLPAGKDNMPLAALGFLTVGRRFMNNPNDIIDDRIDVVFRGFMGLTVACARCHDHKYDPIPTADYYSLHGVFASSTEPKEPPVLDPASMTGDRLAFEAEYAKKRKAAEDFAANMFATHLAKFRTADAVTAYMLAARELRNKQNTVEKVATERKLEPVLLTRWRDYLASPARKTDPVFAAWLAVVDLPDTEFVEKGTAKLNEMLKSGAKPAINPVLAEALRTAAPDAIDEVADVYGDAIADAFQATKSDPKADPNRVQLAAVVAPGAKGPTDLVQGMGPDAADKFVPIAVKKQYRELRNAADKFRVESPNAPARAMSLADLPNPVQPVVYLRGNPNNHGPKVPRQFVSLGGAVPREPFKDGSGRLELAKAVASPDNPLTARVMANRIWAHHFGQGLVRTPSDFGVRTELPVQHELLDWLAKRFVEDGWSVKSLHRRIMLSAAYQQASDITPSLAQHDPENQLLGRQNRQRLEFEPLRDSMLAAAGHLDPTLYGKSIDLFKKPFPNRRTMYGFIDRQNLPGPLRAFDLASPDQHTPQRFLTTVPQQALYLMNNAFVAEQAKTVIARKDVAAATEPGEKARAAYRAVLGRNPTAAETEAVKEFVAGASAKPAGGQLGPWEMAAQVLLLSNEFAFAD